MKREGLRIKELVLPMELVNSLEEVLHISHRDFKNHLIYIIQDYIRLRLLRFPPKKCRKSSHYKNRYLTDDQVKNYLDYLAGDKLINDLILLENE